MKIIAQSRSSDDIFNPKCRNFNSCHDDFITEHALNIIEVNNNAISVEFLLHSQDLCSMFSN